MEKYNTKDLEKAISKKTDIKLKLESMSIDYSGEGDFIKILERFEKACEKVGEESFRLRFKKQGGRYSSYK